MQHLILEPLVRRRLRFLPELFLDLTPTGLKPLLSLTPLVLQTVEALLFGLYERRNSPLCRWSWWWLLPL